MGKTGKWRASTLTNSPGTKLTMASHDWQTGDACEGFHLNGEDEQTGSPDGGPPKPLRWFRAQVVRGQDVGEGREGQQRDNREDAGDEVHGSTPGPEK